MDCIESNSYKTIGNSTYLKISSSSFRFLKDVTLMESFEVNVSSTVKHQYCDLHNDSPGRCEAIIG